MVLRVCLEILLQLPLALIYAGRPVESGDAGQDLLQTPAPYSRVRLAVVHLNQLCMMTRRSSRQSRCAITFGPTTKISNCDEYILAGRWDELRLHPVEMRLGNSPEQARTNGQRSWRRQQVT